MKKGGSVRIKLKFVFLPGAFHDATIGESEHVANEAESGGVFRFRGGKDAKEDTEDIRNPM